MEMAKTEWAETGEIATQSEHFETTLDQAGFFFPEAKAEGMKTNTQSVVAYALNPIGCANFPRDDASNGALENRDGD